MYEPVEGWAVILAITTATCNEMLSFKKMDCSQTNVAKNPVLCTKNTIKPSDRHATWSLQNVTRLHEFLLFLGIWELVFQRRVSAWTDYQVSYSLLHIKRM